MALEQKKELKAIHTHDLAELLRKYNQYENFVDNNISCYICGEKINEDNVSSLRLGNSKLEFTCNKTSCYSSAIRHKASA